MKKLRGEDYGILIIIVFAFFAFRPSHPSPSPVPSPVPVPEVKDLWTECSKSHRKLFLEQVVAGVQTSQFANDDEKLKWIEEHSKAAYRAAYTPLNTEFANAIKNNTLSSFSDMLRKGMK